MTGGPKRGLRESVGLDAKPHKQGKMSQPHKWLGYRCKSGTWGDRGNVGKERGMLLSLGA